RGRGQEARPSRGSDPLRAGSDQRDVLPAYRDHDALPDCRRYGGRRAHPWHHRRHARAGVPVAGRADANGGNRARAFSGERATTGADHPLCPCQRGDRAGPLADRDHTPDSAPGGRDDRGGCARPRDRTRDTRARDHHRPRDGYGGRGASTHNDVDRATGRMMERRRIWVPEAPMLNLRRYVEVGAVRHAIAVEGYFTVELIHARSGLVKRRLRFRNLITNAGLDALAGGTGISDLINYLAVGTGSSEPSYTDTTLNAEIARTNSNAGFGDSNAMVGSGDLVEYWRRIRTRVFTENQANGNLAELGFFSAADGGTMWNRQLFRDELGNPTAITKTPEDQLRVRYEYRIYPPWDDVVQEIEVNGVPTEVVNRPSRVADSTFWGPGTTASNSGALNNLGLVGNSRLIAYNTDTLPGRNGTPSGSSSEASFHEVQSYTPGTFYREREARWE